MERITKILKDRHFQEYVNKNAAAEKERKFCHHDFEHLLSVARIAYILVLERGLKDNFTQEIVYASGLLHDIGRWVEYETGKDHALVSAELARSILEKAGFERDEAAGIVCAIKEHRGSEGTERTPLGDILHRADVLSRPCWKCPAGEECYKFEQMPTNQGPWY